MDATEVTDALFRYFNAYRGYRYQLCNAYVFKWESDFFCIASSGYSYEVEVKVSRSDFFADFNKKKRHRILSWDQQKYVKQVRVNPAKNFEYLFSLPFEYGLFRSGQRGIRPPCSSISIVDHNDVCPNKFYFAVPAGLVEEDEVPDYAGLIYISEDKRYKPDIIKRAPALHSSKKDFTKILLQKYYWAYLNSLDKPKAGKNFEFPDQHTNGNGQKMVRTR